MLNNRLRKKITGSLHSPADEVPKKKHDHDDSLSLKHNGVVQHKKGLVVFVNNYILTALLLLLLGQNITAEQEAY